MLLELIQNLYKCRYIARQRKLNVWTILLWLLCAHRYKIDHFCCCCFQIQWRYFFFRWSRWRILFELREVSINCQCETFKILHIHAAEHALFWKMKSMIEQCFVTISKTNLPAILSRNVSECGSNVSSKTQYSNNVSLWHIFIGEKNI